MLVFGWVQPMSLGVISGGGSKVEEFIHLSPSTTKDHILFSEALFNHKTLKFIILSLYASPSPPHVSLSLSSPFLLWPFRRRGGNSSLTLIVLRCFTMHFDFSTKLYHALLIAHILVYKLLPLLKIPAIFY